MKITRIPTYKADDGRVVTFHRLNGNGVPGFTHRVAIDGVGRDWLSVEFKPSIEAAAYYLEKHATC